MHLIIIILFVGLFLLMLIPAIIISLIRTVLSWFGVVPKKKRTTYYHRTTWNAGDFNGQHDEPKEEQGSAERKKLFDKDEGEYVDYEEVD